MVRMALLVCSVAEHQVAGLGGGERERDGLEVAQLADGDDVGVLAQGGAQRAGEGAGVAADLALVDHAALRAGGCTRSGPRW